MEKNGDLQLCYQPSIAGVRFLGNGISSNSSALKERGNHFPLSPSHARLFLRRLDRVYHVCVFFFFFFFFDATADEFMALIVRWTTFSQIASSNL